MRKKPVLRGLSLQLKSGDAYALLGANGAGKSTTLRILVGLSSPDRGTGNLLGHSLGDSRGHEKLGYLPESPSFHEQLTAVEFLTYCGQLVGLRGATLRRRIDELLSRVCLEHARDRRLRKMSKGMLQRIGLCQALLADPQLLILDEPMSGLDPPGRKLVRDLILEQRDAGKTVLFSTHILSDAEVVCTRAGILREGRLCTELHLDDLGRSSQMMEVVLRGLAPKKIERLRGDAKNVVEGRGHVLFKIASGQPLERFLRQALSLGATVQSVSPSRSSLEDLYVEVTKEFSIPGTSGSGDLEEQRESIPAGRI